MTATHPARGELMESCWSRIGVYGDRSCPELVTFVHCRNCPVIGRAARQLFEVPAPAGYAREWRDAVAAPVAADPASTSVVVFRLGREWLAIDTVAVAEVAELRTVHRVAHRTHTLLAGIVNIRGKIQLCLSLAELLDVAKVEPGAEGALPSHGRLAVIQSDGETWVFPVDELRGVHRFPTGELVAPPATLPAALASLTRGTFRLGDDRITYLDGMRLHAALRGALA